MKAFFYIIIFIFITSCSFDDKSGIWNNDKNVVSKSNKIFQDFETVSTSNELFNKSIPLNKNYLFQLSSPINNKNWKDVHYGKNNNFKNFSYEETNSIIFKSKKISNATINNLLSESNNIILSDVRGNLIIYSLEKKKVISSFNFYKKKFKKVEKNLNLIVEDNVIYVSDNLGYLYAFDYVKDSIVWAKNYKIPFRSNLKTHNYKLIGVNQNNILYFINKKTGDIIKTIPTEDTKFNNNFVNNLSINENATFFLNTFGSLYKINNSNEKIIWFLNLKESLDINPGNLFNSNPVITFGDNLIASSNNFTYILNSTNGAIKYKEIFTPLVKPLINNENLFLISKNNFLVSFNLRDGKIIYSYDINKKIADFLNTKKKQVKFLQMMMINSKLYIFLKNSYVLKFSVDGNLENVLKLPSKINSEPILLEGKIFYINKKNRLVGIN